MDREELIEELAKWIDAYVIAEMILSHLEDSGEPLTLKRAKESWLQTLEHLGGNVGVMV